MKHVPALYNNFTKPIHEYENLTETECVSLCVKSVHCSITKSSSDGYCSHFEANSVGTWKLATALVESDIWLAKYCNQGSIC
jgi:hypothetical protein